MEGSEGHRLGKWCQSAAAFVEPDRAQEPSLGFLQLHPPSHGHTEVEEGQGRGGDRVGGSSDDVSMTDDKLATVSEQEGGWELAEMRECRRFIYREKTRRREKWRSRRPGFSKDS